MHGFSWIIITMLVRKSNAGIEAGRKAASWVIGDQKFVREVMSSAEAHRLRISRFEHAGADLIKIATTIGKHFGVTVQTIQIRQRGGAGANARKVFAYCACRVYHAPTTKVGEFLGVGGAAVFAMAAKGEAVAGKQRLDI
jgi:hypothetical protein